MSPKTQPQRSAPVPIDSQGGSLCIYDTQQAALYLGVHIATVKYHLNKTHRLKPDGNIGRGHYFTRATLDSFAGYLDQLKPGPKPKASQPTAAETIP